MTIVVDTSIWIALLKDASGSAAAIVQAEAGNETVLMVPPVRMELLQGCRGEAEWTSVLARLDAFDVLPMSSTTWDGAARMYFALRQKGMTVRSALDCCIAQLCIENNATLLHDDRDYQTIAAHWPLLNRRLDLRKA